MLYEKILQDDPSFKLPNMDSWSDHIRLMMERDSRTEEQIKYLINWSQNNPFWKSNILSTKKLREKATTLIRQIKAEYTPSSIQRRQGNGRTEIVPEWFHKRNEENPAPVPVEVGQEMDFEAERQKILATLKNIGKKVGNE